MIERKFVAEQMKEFMIQEFITQSLKNVGHSHTKVQRTPLGEKIIVFASRPGLVVGRKGENIKKLTVTLKKKFNLENPQIEISEVENLYLDADIMAEKIVNYLEKFGTTRFKSIGHKIMSEVMKAGAMGIEILITGKIPSSRSKSWRFYQGYLKKCGDIALTGVNSAKTSALLKTGIIGIKVKIMPPDTKLPDDVRMREEPVEVVEEIKEEKAEKKTKKKARKKRKKAAKKKGSVTEEKAVESPKENEKEEETKSEDKE